MSRYNAWQNEGLEQAMLALNQTELRKDRKAFFGSIWSTANHLLWGDKMWLSRLSGGPPPGGTPGGLDLHSELQPFLDDRRRTDGHITRWAGRLTHVDLVGPLTWYSGLSGRNVTQSKAMCIMHFFNHQTHHRGQIHAMLTAAGHKTMISDLAFMPEAF